MGDSVLPTHQTPTHTCDCNKTHLGDIPSKLWGKLRHHIPDKVKQKTIALVDKSKKVKKATWRDIFAIALLSLIVALLQIVPPLATHYLPLDPMPTHLAYPYIRPTFPTFVATALSYLIPLSGVALTQLWLRPCLDLDFGIIGLNYAIITSGLISVILKKTIGGLRPHFLSVCKPVSLEDAIGGSLGKGHRSIMFSVWDICTVEDYEIHNALESFPSGSAQVAFAGFGFLSIYLYAHLDCCSHVRRRGSFWRMILVTAPLLFATGLSAIMVRQYHHSWHEVVFSAVVGWLLAMFGYRMMFRALWTHPENMRTVRGHADIAKENEEDDELNGREKATFGVHHRSTDEPAVTQDDKVLFRQRQAPRYA